MMHGTGKPVMLIRGYPLSMGLFRDNIEAITEAGYTVVTPSMRGFGRSHTPTDSASIDIYSDDMLAVMDALQIDTGAVLGMSMRGWTLFDMYRKAPGRFTGLAFNDTTAVPAPLAEAALWDGLARQVREQGVASIVDLLNKDMFTGETRMNNAPLVDYLGSLMEDASVDGAVGGAGALAERPDLTDVLPSVKVSRLFLFGKEDTLTPANLAQEMAEMVTVSEAVLNDSASHAAVLEQPEEANAAILDWLERTETGS